MLMCLAGIAGVARAEGQLERAGRLYGNRGGATGEKGSHLDLIAELNSERTVPAARTQWGEERWHHAWAKGRAMTIEQAIAYALEGTDE